MRFAADLHLHSRYSSAVSKDMTVETIAIQARRKGINLIGSADCLQPQWLWELEQHLVPAEEGWYKLNEEVETEIKAGLPENLWTDLRWVLSTEVSCAPAGTPRLGGIHFLLYFPSFDSVRRFQKKVERFGDLWEGRPELRLSPLQLLEMVLEHGDGCRMAPAHVMNPYFSSLGSNEKHATLEEIFGDSASKLLAIETGLTSIPSMCRRIASLDRHALFANSDAHSPEKIGRECTLLEIEPGYEQLFSALWSGSKEQVLGTLKVPLYRTRYFLNRCSPCAESFEGKTCPKCGGRLIVGSRDYLESIASRPALENIMQDPPYRQLLSLKEILAGCYDLKPDSKSQSFLEHFEHILKHVGHERHVLTEADYDFLARKSTPQIAKAVVAQRQADTEFFKPRVKVVKKTDEQISLF